MIKVLIVDDSSVVRSVLRDWLKQEKNIKIIGEASDGLEAVEMVKNLAPDLVIMDILMPRMDGLQATEIIMAYHPTPILVFSSALNSQEINIAFEAISRGALDVMPKPDRIEKKESRVKEELIKKIQILSRVPVIPHPRAKLHIRKPEGEPLQAEPVKIGFPKQPYEILGIGASTGGPKAVCDILREFPEDFPIPIVIVQHIVDTFIEGMANWLNRESELTVKVAVAGESLIPGVAYLSPPGKHLLVKDHKIVLSDSDPLNNCKPSVDVLFRSLAEAYGKRVIAVLLTGMGNDGALGMKAIHDQGGRTFAQDEESSIVFGMPASAIELGAVDEVLPVEKIPLAIFRAVGLKKKTGRK